MSSTDRQSRLDLLELHSKGKQTLNYSPFKIELMKREENGVTTYTSSIYLSVPRKSFPAGETNVLIMEYSSPDLVSVFTNTAKTITSIYSSIRQEAFELSLLLTHEVIELTLDQTFQRTSR